MIIRLFCLGLQINSMFEIHANFYLKTRFIRVCAFALVPTVGLLIDRDSTPIVL